MSLDAPLIGTHRRLATRSSSTAKWLHSERADHYQKHWHLADRGCQWNTDKLIEGHTCICEHVDNNSRPHHVFICFTKIFSRQRDTHVEDGVNLLFLVFMSLHSWWYNTPVKLLQNHTPNLGHLYWSLCVCLSCHDCLYGWAPPSSSSTFCMHGKQTAICGILLWVEPCVTTDLYIGTLSRRPVAMAPRVADAEKGWGLKKVLILKTENQTQSYRVWAVCQILVLLFKKAGKSLRDLIEL